MYFSIVSRTEAPCEKCGEESVVARVNVTEEIWPFVRPFSKVSYCKQCLEEEMREALRDEIRNSFPTETSPVDEG